MINQPYQQPNSIPYPNPFDPGNPIYQWTQGNPPVVGGASELGKQIGQGVASAASSTIGSFWQRSGSTIILGYIGLSLVGLGILGYVLTAFVHIETPKLTVGTYRQRIN